MSENPLEGSLILEKMNAIGKLEKFYQAIDADDLQKVRSLMSEADIEPEIIEAVVSAIQEGD